MKDKLSACVTMQDSYDLFKSLDLEVLKDFVNALDATVKFIDLTMRDEFLLNQAKYEIGRR
jgi:hypothetical protein